MFHNPIHIHSFELSLPHKVCFKNFTTQILFGNRIALIGRNGSGKSSLLKMIKDYLESFQDITFGFVPQVIDTLENLSGGQRFNQKLTHALSCEPNVLLLDEPTNHLDIHNRKSFIRFLKAYPGTLIIASHDKELLNQCVDTFWHIDDGKVNIFSGMYGDYLSEIQRQRFSVEQELSRLGRQKKDMHQALMKEQERAKKSNLRGKKSIRESKWPTIVSSKKARQAVETAGIKKQVIDQKKQGLSEQLKDLRLPEIIIPKFSINASSNVDYTILSVKNGSVGYRNKVVLSDINLSMLSKDRVAILGNNGSGKSTLLKALLNDIQVMKTGDWDMTKVVGYLDQHYSTLNIHQTVFDSVSILRADLSNVEIRRHLNNFLFRKNEEVNTLISTLSGGEKARLCLAHIAFKTPQLLILDEVTNNLDLETKDHMITVLKDFPAAMIIILHDLDFLKQLSITDFYEINEGTLNLYKGDL